MSKNKVEEVEDFEELDGLLDKMRVLEMALWGCEYQGEPKEEYTSALSSFAGDIVDDMEELVEKNKPKQVDMSVR
jgi:hypothetical protein